MRLILLIAFTWVTACGQKDSLDLSHEVIGAVTLNEKAPHFETILLAQQTDTRWIDFWEDNLVGDWVGKSGKQVNLNEVIGKRELVHLKNQYKQRIMLAPTLLPAEIGLVDPMDFKGKIDYQYYKISTPAFTKDGKYSLVYWEDVCHLDCGGGGLLVYHQNETGEWERLLSRYLWMS